MIEKYVKPLVIELENNSSEEAATPMINYMRGQFKFLGLKKPLREEIIRSFIKENGHPQKEEMKDFIKYLWNKPEREYQYTAMDILAKNMKVIDKSYIDFFEYLIITKSWWDTVDMIAAKFVGEVFKNYPEFIPDYIEKWMNSNNMWLQRTALLFQLKYKNKTNEKLLYSLIKRLSHSEEFFIRKAIGWALREYSKWNPQSVKKFIETNGLKPLSEKEGMKIINKN